MEVEKGFGGNDFENNQPAFSRGEEFSWTRADVLSRRGEQFENIYAEEVSCRSNEMNEFELRAAMHVLLMRCEGTASRCDVMWPEEGHRQSFPEVKPGSTLFIPAGGHARFRKKDQGTFSYIVVRIPPSALHLVNDQHLDSTRLALRPQAGRAREELRRILLAMRDEIRAAGPAGRLYRETLALPLVIQLLRHSSELTIRPETVSGGLSAHRLRRALELIEADLTNTPSLSQLASRVGLSPAHFCTAFKQSTGYPPRQYLLKRRVAYAMDLIAQSQRSLTDIALDSGFANSSQFATAFRRIHGTTPSAYRRSL